MTPKSKQRKPRASSARQPFEVFQQAISEHRFISEYSANVQRTTALFNEKRFTSKIAALKSFLTQNVVEHFHFEEESVFPQLQTEAQTAATRQVVAELLDEHKPLLAAARRLHRRLDQAGTGADAHAWTRLEQAIHKFLKTLQEHALKEDNIFLAEKYAHRSIPAAPPAITSLDATVHLH